MHSKQGKARQGSCTHHQDATQSLPTSHLTHAEKVILSIASLRAYLVCLDALCSTLKLNSQHHSEYLLLLWPSQRAAVLLQAAEQEVENSVKQHIVHKLIADGSSDDLLVTRAAALRRYATALTSPTATLHRVALLQADKQ